MIALLTSLDKRLAGWPDELLTVSLIAIAILTLIIAFKAKPAVKATALLYEGLP